MPAQGTLTVTQDVELPGTLVDNCTGACLAGLFPNAGSVVVTGSTVKVPVEVTTAVQATAVLTSNLGELVTVEVGCTTAFLSAFQEELTSRANVSADIISNVSCSSTGSLAAAVNAARTLLHFPHRNSHPRTHREDLAHSPHHPHYSHPHDHVHPDLVSTEYGSALHGQHAQQAQHGAQHGTQHGAQHDAQHGGRALLADPVCAGTGSLNLMVMLSVPVEDPDGPAFYKARLLATMDEWTQESVDGTGKPGGLQLCGPTSEDVIVSTNVRVMTEVPLSSTGADNLASVCGAQSLEPTTALGGDGSQVACRVTTASTGDGGAKPNSGGSSPPPAVSSASSTSYLPLIIAAAVVGAVVGAVCLAVLFFVAGRSRRRRRKEEEQPEVEERKWSVLAPGGPPGEPIGSRPGTGEGGNQLMPRPSGGSCPGAVEIAAANRAALHAFARHSTTTLDERPHEPAGTLNIVLPSDPQRPRGNVQWPTLRRGSLTPESEAQLKRAVASALPPAPASTPRTVTGAEGTGRPVLLSPVIGSGAATNSRAPAAVPSPARISATQPQSDGPDSHSGRTSWATALSHLVSRERLSSSPKPRKSSNFGNAEAFEQGGASGSGPVSRRFSLFNPTFDTEAGVGEPTSVAGLANGAGAAGAVAVGGSGGPSSGGDERESASRASSTGRATRSARVLPIGSGPSRTHMSLDGSPRAASVRSGLSGVSLKNVILGIIGRGGAESHTEPGTPPAVTSGADRPGAVPEVAGLREGSHDTPRSLPSPGLLLPVPPRLGSPLRHASHPGPHGAAQLPSPLGPRVPSSHPSHLKPQPALSLAGTAPGAAGRPGSSRVKFADSPVTASPVGSWSGLPLADAGTGVKVVEGSRAVGSELPPRPPLRKVVTMSPSAQRASLDTALGPGRPGAATSAGVVSGAVASDVEDSNSAAERRRKAVQRQKSATVLSGSPSIRRWRATHSGVPEPGSGLDPPTSDHDLPTVPGPPGLRAAGASPGRARGAAGGEARGKAPSAWTSLKHIKTAGLRTGPDLGDDFHMALPGSSGPSITAASRTGGGGASPLPAGVGFGPAEMGPVGPRRGLSDGATRGDDGSPRAGPSLAGSPAPRVSKRFGRGTASALD